jgi:hypothetical protein
VSPSATGIELIVGPTLGRDDPAKRLVVVLICYFDDSYESEAPFMSIGGWIAAYPDWIVFERQVKPIFDRNKVSVLEGKKLHNTRGDFKDWKVRKKEKFVGQLIDALKPAAMFGLYFAVQTDNYAKAKLADGLNQNESAFGYAFRIALDHIFCAAVVQRAFSKKGWRTQIVLEQGNKNNADAQRIYNQLLFIAPYGHLLGGFSEAPKDSSRALQMADLLAFYSRRYTVACARAGRYLPHPPVFKPITTSGIPLSSMVVTGFHAGHPKDLISDAGFRRASSGDDFTEDFLK